MSAGGHCNGHRIVLWLLSVMRTPVALPPANGEQPMNDRHPFDSSNSIPERVWLAITLFGALLLFIVLVNIFVR